MQPRIQPVRLSMVFAAASVAGIIAAAVPAQTASANTFQTLYSFQPSGDPTDGATPYSRLTAARHAFFGTTEYGGTGPCTNAQYPSGCGTVYELSPVRGGGWTETVIYNFQGGSDGALPLGHLIYVKGAFYGTTESGGGGGCEVIGTGCGTIFGLKKKGASWTETVLYRFTGGADGANPYVGLLAGSNGVFYGTTGFGGNNAQHCNEGAEGSGCGVAFALAPSGNAWTESVLHTFTGYPDGANPASDLTLSSAGILYGTTPYGGNNGCNVGCGTVFSLTQSGGNWTESVLYALQGGTDGAEPAAGPLLAGENGVLYGTTESGGGSGCDGEGCGTVFELTPPSQGETDWTEALIYSFQGGADSWGPFAGLTQGKHGALYGTTYGYYALSSGNRYGTVFELAPPGKSGGSWTYSLLHGFSGSGSDGCFPIAGVIAEKGVLYGSTTYCGASDQGMLFSLTL